MGFMDMCFRPWSKWNLAQVFRYQWHKFSRWKLYWPSFSYSWWLWNYKIIPISLFEKRYLFFQNTSSGHSLEPVGLLVGFHIQVCFLLRSLTLLFWNLCILYNRVRKIRGLTGYFLHILCITFFSWISFF